MFKKSRDPRRAVHRHGERRVELNTLLPWPLLGIQSWRSFVSEVAQFTGLSEIDPAYLFRGQADAAWRLQPSLTRLLPIPAVAARACAMEEECFAAFGAQFHLMCSGTERHLYEPDTELLDWWPEIQHYGSPTRLLDWTASPYVAAYFAAISEPKRDGAIYAWHPATITSRWGEIGELSPRQWWADDPPKGVFFFSPRRKSQRVAAQQGHFSIPGDPAIDHQQVVVNGRSPEDRADSESSILRKWIVPASLKSEFI